MGLLSGFCFLFSLSFVAAEYKIFDCMATRSISLVAMDGVLRRLEDPGVSIILIGFLIWAFRGIVMRGRSFLSGCPRGHMKLAHHRDWRLLFSTIATSRRLLRT